MLSAHDSQYDFCVYNFVHSWIRLFDSIILLFHVFHIVANVWARIHIPLGGQKSCGTTLDALHMTSHEIRNTMFLRMGHQIKLDKTKKNKNKRKIVAVAFSPRNMHNTFGCVEKIAIPKDEIRYKKKRRQCSCTVYEHQTLQKDSPDKLRDMHYFGFGFRSSKKKKIEEK